MQNLDNDFTIEELQRLNNTFNEEEINALEKDDFTYKEEDFKEIKVLHKEIKSKLISIRLKLKTINSLKKIAESLGIRYQTLLKEIVEEWVERKSNSSKKYLSDAYSLSENLAKSKDVIVNPKDTFITRRSIQKKQSIVTRVTSSYFLKSNSTSPIN